jgi:hypothetical protein
VSKFQLNVAEGVGFMVRRKLQVIIELIGIYGDIMSEMPIPVAARSKAWVFGRSLTRIVCSNPTGGMDVCVVFVVCCQVEVSATDWSLVQRSRTECGVSDCVIVKPRKMRQPRPPRGLSSH